MSQLHHYVVPLLTAVWVFAENVRKTQMVVEVMEMGRHKERVKLLASYVVQPESVQPLVVHQRVPEIQIHVLQVLVHVG